MPSNNNDEVKVQGTKRKKQQKECPQLTPHKKWDVTLHTKGGSSFQWNESTFALGNHKCLETSEIFVWKTKRGSIVAAFRVCFVTKMMECWCLDVQWKRCVTFHSDKSKFSVPVEILFLWTNIFKWLLDFLFCLLSQCIFWSQLSQVAWQPSTNFNLVASTIDPFIAWLFDCKWFKFNQSLPIAVQQCQTCGASTHWN